MYSFITSHKQRALRADTALENSPEKATRQRRRAFIAYYLIDDVVRLLEYRSKQTDDGQIAALFDNYSRLRSEVKQALDSGEYRKVCKAIPERKLYSAAGGGIENGKLRDIASDIRLDITGELIIFDKSTGGEK